MFQKKLQSLVCLGPQENVTLLRLRIQQIDRPVTRIQDRLSEFRTEGSHTFIIACNGDPGKRAIALDCRQRGGRQLARPALGQSDVAERGRTTPFAGGSGTCHPDLRIGTEVICVQILTLCPARR